MILTEYVVIRPRGKSISHYKNLGYDAKYMESLKVDPYHLSKYSEVKVKAKCDCGKINDIVFCNYYTNTKNLKEKYKCKNCTYKETCLKNHGVENVIQSIEIQNKIKNTTYQNYGVEHIFKDDNIKKKIKNTNLKKYGTEYPIQNNDIKKKAKKTNLNRYGVDNVMSIPDVIKKINDKKFIKYGKILTNEYNLINYNGNDDVTIKHNKCNSIDDYTTTLIINRINYNVVLCKTCNPISKFTSNKENQLKEYINFLDIEFIENDRSILNGKELDIYIPSKNLAIEFNGLYWHSELYKPNNYHKMKTEMCEQKGVNLLHIFEDDWLYKQEIVKSIIKNKLGIIEKKIYARQTEIKNVKSGEARMFLDNNHIQGFSKSSYKLGLYYNNELVSLMTFGYRRTNSKKEFELIRFCNKIDYTIVGAASKLFKHFIKNYSDSLEESYLISYADISLFDGNLYNQLGFEKKHRTKPNYFWVVDNKREHRFKYNKQKLIKNGANPLLTEREIMFEKGHYRIFGSGQDRYEYYF